MESTLHLLGGGNLAYGCNDLGEIVGLDDDSGNSNAVAMYWTNANAAGQVLPGLPNDTRWGAQAISEDGVICGWSQAPSADGLSMRSTAVLWRVSAGAGGQQVWGPMALETLGSLPGVTDFAYATDVADQDAGGAITVVGESNALSAKWTVRLDAAGGLSAETATVLDMGGPANATNNSGIICGRANLDTSTSNTEPVVWIHEVGQLLSLGRSAATGTPLDINEGGVIVGYTGFSRAVVWPTANADPIELDRFLRNSPFSALGMAQAINGAGEIVGGGTKAGQSFYSPFLAVPK